ncbi:MAG: FAD-dependent oxidoreductase, partial [Planctomycetota bacterium]|nr:FAD-dependent oxidoreductase [Planctomycetota bacterium]
MTGGKMRELIRECDFTVVGGGMAGLCCAIAAARHGVRTCLVHDRPVLGGNASSESGVWIAGATGGANNRFAREGGIIEEILMTNRYVNPEGNRQIWDAVLFDFALREKNLALDMNASVCRAEVEPAGHIRSCTAWQLGTETWITYRSRFFADCSGDGTLGALAGAPFRRGREARDEFGESLAPEKADGLTMGQSIVFATRRMPHKVRFVKPSFARDISATSVVSCRPIAVEDRDQTYMWWWVEYGGTLDTIHDAEEIRFELIRLAYGIWDYIKNSGKFPADNLQLDWISRVPGKRENRRFAGDYILRERDLFEQTRFPDRVAHGGWSIDHHPPEGIYSKEPPSRHIHLKGIYDVPFRCLYSSRVGNLFFAGRDVSVTNVAFGSTRVMATCAAMGQAVGTAVAICLERGAGPRDIVARHMPELHRRLREDDQHIVGIRWEDPAMEGARVSASGCAVCENPDASGELLAAPLDETLLFTFPLTAGRIERIEMCVESEAARTLRAGLWRPERDENFYPDVEVAAAEARVGAGRGWAAFEFGIEVDVPGFHLLRIEAAPGAKLILNRERLFGCFLQRCARHAGRPFMELTRRRMPAGTPVFRCVPAAHEYVPSDVLSGYERPFRRPNAWISERLQPGRETWLQVDLPEERQLAAAALVLDTDPVSYTHL